jgi:hypothetical protein
VAVKGLVKDSWFTWGVSKAFKKRGYGKFRLNFMSSGGGARSLVADKIILVLNKPVLDMYLNSPTGEVGRYLYGKALLIQQAARAQVGVDTGKLKSSIHIRRGRSGPGQYVEIGSPLSYALMHHEGTSPHPIVPKRTSVLRFSAGGRMVYTRLVLHPGTRPNRYLSDHLYLVRV